MFDVKSLFAYRKIQRTGVKMDIKAKLNNQN
jgi:hypothetical protein